MAKKKNLKNKKRKKIKPQKERKVKKTSRKKGIKKRKTIKKKVIKKKENKVLRISRRLKPKIKIKKKSRVKKTPVKNKLVKRKLIKKKKAPQNIVIPKVVRRRKEIRTDVVDVTLHKTKVRIIGIGGGGGTIVSEIANRVKKADFYAANTDTQALRKLARSVKRFQFGQDLTRGLGTGMNSDLGGQAAQTEEEKIEKLLEDQDLCVIIASLGGGTSSGASPVFAKISKNMGNITYGIFTLPFEFEGEKKMEIAKESLEKIKPHLNVYTIIPNERIFQIIDKNTPLKEALSAINTRLADNLEGLIEMIYLPGLINIDFADLKTVLAGKGRLTYLNTIEVEGPNKDEAIKKLISSHLYPYTIKGSKGILYNIVSDKNIQLSEVSYISNIISEAVSKKAKIIFGINQSKKNKGRTKITLLATGCFSSGFSPSPKTAPKIKKIVGNIKKIKTTKKNPKKRRKAISRVRISRKKSRPTPSKQKNKAKIKKFKKKKKTPLKSVFPKNKAKKISKKTAPKKNKISLPGKHALGIYQGSNERQGGDVYGGDKVRKNALQVRKEAEEAEKEILEKEKIWEIPAILRRKK